jgi:hypothetical protein
MFEEVKKIEGPGCINCKPACCEKIYLVLNDEESDIVLYGRNDSEENPIDYENEPYITKVASREKVLVRRQGEKPKYEYPRDFERRRDTREYILLEEACGNLISLVDEKSGRTFLGCKFHGQPEQPLVCSSGFPERGYACMKLREERLRAKD